MTETTIRQPTPTQKAIDRLDDLQKGAAVLMFGFLVVGAALTIAQGSNRIALSVGLHLINAGITMVIAVGAIANHKIILQKLADNDRVIEHLISAAGDEVADQRGGHQR
jgi:hypothetical protein